MKLNSFIFLVLFLAGFQLPAFSIDYEKKYHSKEEDEYYNTRRSDAEPYKEFEPVSLETARANTRDYVKVISIPDPVWYQPEKVNTPYWDSIMTANKELRDDFNKFDSLMGIAYRQKIGNISRMNILKEGHLNNRYAYIYTDMKYDDFIFGGVGYWIALSEDNGKTWKEYYTGLTENSYYFFKRNSNVPLWADDNTLQIEAAIVRQETAVCHPMPASFGLVDDGLKIQLDLNKIMLDSDHDGLTDIAEEKMLLNPLNADTDGDGIPDGIDKNPRFRSVKYEKSIVYECLMDSRGSWNKFGMLEIDTAHPPVHQKERAIPVEFEKTTLLVTDDPVLQGINLEHNTYIIMTSAEYEKYKEKFPSHFIESDYSPLFKCDHYKNTYVLSTHELTGGSTYVVKKTKKGWRISLLSSFIS